MAIQTGYERYSKHAVWEQLQLKRDALHAARSDDATVEQRRNDIVEWLDEALKTRAARQPALYLTALDQLSATLNDLPTTPAEFRQYAVPNGYNNRQALEYLEDALRRLPLPAPKDLKSSYVDLLDKEVEARTARLDELLAQIKTTEKSLSDRMTQLDALDNRLTALQNEIQTERDAITSVTKTAEAEINAEWSDFFTKWKADRDEKDRANNAQALEQVALLAATTKAGEKLAEHAAGALSATDWYGRGKRERRAAQWIRAGAAAAFIFAGSVGYYIVHEAIAKDFDLTLGGGILRASVAVVIAGFGALLLRESGRHFREADTAEDVALSMNALAPFYANSDEGIRLAARTSVGDAVLVKNVLSRFSHRDAAKHGHDANAAELSKLVEDATAALKATAAVGSKTAGG